MLNVIFSSRVSHQSLTFLHVMWGEELEEQKWEKIAGWDEDYSAHDIIVIITIIIKEEQVMQKQNLPAVHWCSASFWATNTLKGLDIVQIWDQSLK